MPALVIAQQTSEDLASTPDIRALSQADPTRLADALALLPERERLILALFYTEDLTVLEVAAVLDIEIREVLLYHAGAIVLLRDLLGNA